MATLQQVHSTLQVLQQKTGGEPVRVEKIAELLQKTSDSVRRHVALLSDLKFAKVTPDGQHVWLTETGLRAQVEHAYMQQQS